MRCPQCLTIGIDEDEICIACGRCEECCEGDHEDNYYEDEVLRAVEGESTQAGVSNDPETDSRIILP